MISCQSKSTMSRSVACSSPAKSPKKVYRYETLAQAFCNRLETDKSYNVFGVVIRSNQSNTLLTLKDESKCELDVHLLRADIGDCFSFHLGDIFRLHRLRYYPESRSFKVKQLDVVLFRSFIPKNTKTANVFHFSKNPTINKSDHERAFELDQWYADQLVANTLSTLTDNIRFTNVAGQLLAIKTYSRDCKILCVWDCTRPPITSIKPDRFSEFDDVPKHKNFDQVSDIEKVYIKVWDMHADVASLMQPGALVFVSNLDIAHRRATNEMEMILRGNFSFGKGLAEITANSTAATLIQQRIDHSIDDLMIIHQIGMDSPMEELTSSQSLPASDFTNAFNDVAVVTPSLEQALNSPMIVPEPSPPVPSTSGYDSRRRKLKDPPPAAFENEQPVKKIKYLGVVDQESNADDEQPNLDERDNVSPNVSLDSRLSCCPYTTSDYYCFRCRQKPMARDRTSDHETRSQASTTILSEDLSQCDYKSNSVESCLRKTRTKKPATVIAYVSDFYPGGESCFSIFDLVFVSCQSCKSLRSFSSQLGTRIEAFAELCKAHAYQNGLDVIDVKISCSRCSTDAPTTIHFHLPLVLTDAAGDSIVAVLTGKVANEFFRTSPIGAVVCEEHRATILDFFENLRNQNKRANGHKHFYSLTLARFGNVYEIIKFSDLLELRLNETDKSQSNLSTDESD